MLSLSAANRAIDWLLGKPATQPLGPLEVALVTELGVDGQPGREVEGGAYQRLAFDVPPAVNGATTNASDIVWGGLPETTIVGLEVWDSSQPPVLLCQGALEERITITGPGRLEWPAGSLVIGLGRG